jgi:hypothetical protein
MTGDGYSNYYGTGHGEGEQPETDPSPDALTRKARERKAWEARRRQIQREITEDILRAHRRAECTCTHDQRKHEDGRGACTDSFQVADGEKVPCICTEFESRFQEVPPAWRQTS